MTTTTTTEPTTTCIEWPSDPIQYEWKGTIDQTSTTWKVLAHCKAAQTDVIIEIKQYQTNHKHDDDYSLESIETFSKQLKEAIAIKHKHLLTPLHSFFFKNEIWTIYRRHSGGMLSELLTTHYPHGIHDESLIAYLLHGIVDGLSYLHKNQKCHRNIRPNSVYFDKDLGISILSDFHQLKSIKYKQKHKQTESIITADREPWTDPLLLIKHPNSSWYSSDIYSIGITALHLVFGTPPDLARKIQQSTLLKLAANPDNSGADSFYDAIGIQLYDVPCPFGVNGKLFELFVNDCTCAISKRINVNKLLQHSFFVKKNIYEADVVKSKIAHLFPSVESEINTAFSAPGTFPNVRNSDEVMQMARNGQSDPVQKVDEGVIEPIAKSNEVDAKNEANEQWNFSASIGHENNEELVRAVSLVEIGSPPISPQTTGRFVVENNVSVSASTSLYSEAVDWDSVRVAQWVASLGEAYKQYKQVFIENGIDGEMLKELTDDLLQEIMPSRLHRAKLLSSAAKLFSSIDAL